MQAIKLTSEGQTAFYAADLAPTVAHLGLAYSLAYDNFPIGTIEDKKKVWNNAVDEDWTIIYEHDAFNEATKIKRNEKGGFEKGNIVVIND